MLLERIHAACIEHAERPALHIRDRSHSYAELARSVAAIREVLDGEFAEERNIGILAYDALETYAAVLAVWFSGKTMVPLGPATPPDRNANMLAQAEVKVVLASRGGDLAGLGRTPDVRFVVTGELPREAPLRAPRARAADDLAYILFTSGSTGVPKGVPISHGALDAFVDAFFALGHRLDERDRFLQMFDLTFDLSLMSYCVPLSLGACAFTVPSDAIKYTAVLRLLDEHAITCALMVPSILAHLRPFFSEIRLEALRHSLFCGEALPADLVDAWSECVPNARIQNVYGPTEATIFCLAYDCERGRPHKAHHGVVSIGRPMRGVRILLVDEQQRDVPSGEQGELCLAGPQLTPGYWRNPDKNREAFFQRGGTTYYRTGDLCSSDADGDIQYCGRLDHQIKVQGFRVELGEIEHHAREVSGVKHVAAIAARDVAGNTAIHLFLEGFDGDTQALLARLRQRLPSYMIPARIETLDALPLNPNGKIDRPALRRRAAGGA